MRRIGAIVLLYGILNAILYSSLLPLWEGFDEMFHYGYVQFLSTKLEFAVLGEATISEEIWHSLELTPVSHYLQPFTKAPLNFGQYFELSQMERLDKRQQLRSLPPGEKFAGYASLRNYEVNQSPLPYLVMAVPDRLLAAFPITARVLCLRILGSVAAVLLTFGAVLILARQLGVPPVYTLAAMMCIFSSQMYYATVAHVCNDWLAVPLMPLLIAATIAAARDGSKRNYVLMAAMLAAALLTKAYFLVLIPLPLGVVAWQLWRHRTNWRSVALFVGLLLTLAGPWYARNAILYENLSATVGSTRGVGLRQVLATVPSVPWLESIAYMARASLWTGNNSFTTFSASTLDVILALLFLSFCLYGYKFRGEAADAITIGATVLFCCGLALITVSFFYSTKGGAIAAVPWYMQVLLPPVLLLAFLGMSRVERIGKLVAAATVLLWAYVLCATYLAKLIPLYGGMAAGRAHFSDLYSWYAHYLPERNAILSTTSLASPNFLYAMTGAVVLLNLGLSATVLLNIFRGRERGGV